MKRRRPAWVVAAGVIALACGCANATPQDRHADQVEPRATASPVEAAHGIDRELSETLQADVDRVREDQSLPGVSAAVVIPGEGVWTGTSGIVDARTKQLVTPDTLFAIGSVTKPFVAALLVQLAQDGVLDLDDRLSRWVPDFPNSDEITVRQLLGHTSGTANFTDDRGFAAAQQRRPGASWSPAETLSFARTPRAKPGAEWAYSNTNYILAGLVLERAAEATVGSQLHRRLLVGPEFSRMLLQPEQRPRGPVATGHEDLDGDSKPDRLATRGYVPTRAFASAAWTAGGMLATAESLARAADGIFRGDLLPTAAREEMTRFKPTGQTEFEYGLGLGRIWLGDQLVWWHNGDYPGFHADLAFVPELGATVVALNNFQRNAPAQDALIDTMISDVSMHLADSP